MSKEGKEGFPGQSQGGDPTQVWWGRRGLRRLWGPGMPPKVRLQTGFYPRSTGGGIPVGRWQLSKREVAVGLDSSSGGGGRLGWGGGIDLTRLQWTESQ